MRTLVAALVAVCALTGMGCGAAAGEGDTTLVLTRDFGQKVVSPAAKLPLSPGLTAMRQLQKLHRTTTAYGGRYVDSIDGLKEDATYSWLYYADGIEADRGATGQRLRAGQTVQWDFHAWSAVRGGGAIVGAWPEPLRSRGARLVCRPHASRACSLTRSALKAAGVAQGGAAAVQVIVGPWSAVKSLGRLPDLAAPANTNGAYAQFSGDSRRLAPVRADGQREGFSQLGLLAAFAAGDAVTWLVTGTDRTRTELAAALLQDPEQLQHRFALAASERGALPLPRTTP